MAHAKLSPSSSGRWMICPGSIARYPDSGRASRAAAEGSVAHEIAAMCLEDRTMRPYSWVGTEMEHDGFTIEVTQDMADDIARYVDTAIEAIGSDPFMVEVAVPIGHITGEEGATGTADLVIFRKDELEVRDLKFGRGVEVDAKDNTQLILYALGALNKFGEVADVPRVRCTIHQPRLSGPKEEVYTIEELLAWGVKIAAGARATAEPDAPLVPSNSGCKFCPGKHDCPKLREETLKEVQSEFDDLSSHDTDQLAEDMRRVERVEAWCKAVRAEVERRLCAGMPVQGWKLVAGRRGPRRWIDESEAAAVLEKALGPDAWEKSLLSPTKADKLIGKAVDLGGLTTSTEGKPSVAPESDKRPALSVAPSADDFDNLEEGN